MICLFYSFFYVLSHLTWLFQSYIIHHFHKPLQALPSAALAWGSGSEEQICTLYKDCTSLYSKDEMEIYGFTERIYPRVSSKKGGSSIWVRIIQSFDLAILSVLRKRKFIFFLAEVTQGRNERQFSTAHFDSIQMMCSLWRNISWLLLEGFLWRKY